MNERRHEAYKLRIKGYSYLEINRELGIAKSTLSSWFRDLVLSESAQSRLRSRSRFGTEALIKRNKAQTHNAYRKSREIRKRAAREIAHPDREELRFIGISLYWAEGYKRARVVNGREVTWHEIAFTNSDPHMIRLFVRFLEECMDIKRSEMKLVLKLFDYLSEELSVRFWSEASGIDIVNIRCRYVRTKSTENNTSHNRLPYGVAKIQVGNSEKFHQLMGWIEGLSGV